MSLNCIVAEKKGFNLLAKGIHRLTEIPCCFRLTGISKSSAKLRSTGQPYLTKAVVINKGIKSRLGGRSNDIVPVAMESVAFQVYSFHLFVGDSPAGGIFPTIQTTRHFQSFSRSRLGN